MADPYYSTLTDDYLKDMEKILQLEEMHIVVFHSLMRKVMNF